MAQTFEQQMIRYHEIEDTGRRIISNKTIMEYTVTYAKEIKWSKHKLLDLNQIRLYKKAMIPGELVGINGRQTTSYF